MKKINYKSDFDFLLRLTDCKGDAVPFPDCDWDARFYTSSKANAYVASCKDGVCVNCIKEEDAVRFVFDRHNLGVGTLKWEPHFEFPNGIYPDGIQDKYEPQPLDIELVPGRGDCATTAEIEAILPVIKGEPGEKMTYADLTEADKADLMAPFKETLTGKADRTELSNIVGEPTDEVFEDIEPGIIRDALRKTEQELTPEEQAQVKKNLGISKMELFCDLFNAAAGNAGYARITNGEFDCKLNELTLTYEEAVLIMSKPRLRSDAPSPYSSNEWLYADSGIRTHLPKMCPDRAVGLRYTFINAKRLEVVNAKIIPMELCFGGCDKLRSVKIHQLFGSNNNEGKQAFIYCKNLTDIYVNTMEKFDCYLQHSPLITKDSFSRIVTATPDSVVTAGGYTIYVHPSVYSKLNDETNTEWHSVLTAAAAKNINFATTA